MSIGVTNCKLTVWPQGKLAYVAVLPFSVEPAHDGLVLLGTYKGCLLSFAMQGRLAVEAWAYDDILAHRAQLALKGTVDRAHWPAGLPRPGEVITVARRLGEGVLMLTDPVFNRKLLG